jgi:hypothetical protein
LFVQAFLKRLNLESIFGKPRFFSKTSVLSRMCKTPEFHMSLSEEGGSQWMDDTIRAGLVATLMHEPFEEAWYEGG